MLNNNSTHVTNETTTNGPAGIPCNYEHRSLRVECMCARGRARDSVTRGAREPTSVALVAMATFQQSNRLQIASCISFPSPCPHPLSFHGLFASLSPSLCPICLFFFCLFFRRRRVEVVLEAAFSTLTGHPATRLLHFSQHYEATLI